MTISFKAVEGKRQVFALWVDGEEKGHVHASIVGRNPQFSSSEGWEAALKTLVCQGAKRYAMKKLSQRSLSTKELEKSLREKLVPEQIVGKIIQECQQLGYLNDEEWAQAFVRVSLAKKRGAQAIAQLLRQKGIQEVTIRSLLQEQAPPEVQKEGIQRLLATRYRSRNLKNAKEKNKTIAALLRKGYDFTLVREVLAKLALD